VKLPDWFVCLGEALMESEAPARCRTTTLTNAEREAVLYCVSCAQDYRDTLDVCEQPEKYDRATQMIEAAMRLAIPNVGPAPAECSRSERGSARPSADSVGGAGSACQEPVAWAILHKDHQYVSLLREHAEAHNVYCDAEVVPLYRHPASPPAEPVVVPSTAMPGNFAGIKWNSCCFQHRKALDKAGVKWTTEASPEPETTLAGTITAEDREAIERVAAFLCGLSEQMFNTATRKLLTSHAATLRSLLERLK
jgi:hypothetical protein